MPGSRTTSEYSDGTTKSVVTRPARSTRSRADGDIRSAAKRAVASRPIQPRKGRRQPRWVRRCGGVFAVSSGLDEAKLGPCGYSGITRGVVALTAYPRDSKTAEPRCTTESPQPGDPITDAARPQDRSEPHHRESLDPPRRVQGIRLQGECRRSGDRSHHRRRVPQPHRFAGQESDHAPDRHPGSRPSALTRIGNSRSGGAPSTSACCWATSPTSCSSRRSYSSSS